MCDGANSLDGWFQFLIGRLKTGYIIYHKKGYSKAGSPKLVSLFREAGLPHGRYMVRKIKDKDSFVATPLIEEHQKNEG